MSWANRHIKSLNMGKTVTFKAGGISGLGMNDVITVEPIGSRKLKRGDIILCHVNGDERLVSIAQTGDGQYLVKRDRSAAGTWTPSSCVWGICTSVGARVSP